MITQGAYVADIGTDHGYLPAWLVKNGICTRVIAADKRPGPLARAVQTASIWGVKEHIQFLISDGLDEIDPHGVDTVVMAGMGGETMVDILSRAPWTLQYDVHLILQPQSKLADLSNWLLSTGYAVRDARLVEDTGRIYIILSVCGRDQYVQFSNAEIHICRILLENQDPLLPAYLNQQICRIRKSICGLEQATLPNVQRLAQQKKVLLDFLTLKEDLENCRK